MTFEDWADIYDCAEENSRMLADWKAERKKLIEALEYIGNMEEGHDFKWAFDHVRHKARIAVAKTKGKP